MADQAAEQVGVTFLRDVANGGAAGQQAGIAAALAVFVGAATTSLDIAIYDFRLYLDTTAGPVVSALTAAAERGVTVRIGYDAGKPSGATAETAFVALEADPAPPGTAEWLQSQFANTAVTIEAITAGSHLMHSKYIVRDAAAVWTGSTNFTDDAWSRQENNILVVADATVAAGYAADFQQLWTAASITGTGKGDGGTTELDGSDFGWGFSPGQGAALDAALTARVQAASRRIVVAAMVLTSHTVLAALAAAIDRGVDVSGIYDGGQMDPIVETWQAADDDFHHQLVAEWTKVAAQLVRKDSQPYSPTSLHNFMHLKVMVTDDVVTTGSFNFSANAQHNAENQVYSADADLVGQYVDFIATLVQQYRGGTAV